MNSKIVRLGVKSLSPSIRYFSASPARSNNYSCKLLVIGGGAGGCTMASKFCRHLKPCEVVILEPSEIHYYQPLWTMVGAGVKSIKATARPMLSVLPKQAVWVRDFAAEVQPEKNTVVTQCGYHIQYDFLIIASGIKINYCKIPGFTEALMDGSNSVATIYSSDFCPKMWTKLKQFEGGNAVFTFPDTPIKCPGAPQKIAYLSDSYLRKRKIRQRANMMYMTATPTLFGVKKYSDALEKVAQRKNISFSLRTVLKEIRPAKKEAVFQKTVLEDCIEVTTTEVIPYELLHVGPPMETPDFIRLNPSLCDQAGYLDVDKFTLQHKKYSNVYGIGDCTNTPNSKTAAAIAKQCYVVEKNLRRTMKDKSATAKYDGYGACPLLTEYGKCILAEFLYDGKVHETFPYDQGQESMIAYLMKRELFPYIYWNFMLKGYYHGPEMVRKIFSPAKFLVNMIRSRKAK